MNRRILKIVSKSFFIEMVQNSKSLRVMGLFLLKPERRIWRVRRKNKEKVLFQKLQVQTPSNGKGKKEKNNW